MKKKFNIKAYLGKPLIFNFKTSVLARHYTGYRISKPSSNHNSSDKLIPNTAISEEVMRSAPTYPNTCVTAVTK